MPKISTRVVCINGKYPRSRLQDTGVGVRSQALNAVCFSLITSPCFMLGLDTEPYHTASVQEASDTQ